jgi:hypothetical protein
MPTLMRRVADIHIGPGQEKHLAHEAWHTVQQKQGTGETNRPNEKKYTG